MRLLVSGVVLQPLEGSGRKRDYRLDVSGRVATIMAAAGEWKATGKQVIEGEKLAADNSGDALTLLNRKHALAKPLDLFNR